MHLIIVSECFTICLSPVSPIFHTEVTVINSPLTIRLFIWETRLGKNGIPDWSTDPCPKLNGEPNKPTRGPVHSPSLFHVYCCLAKKILTKKSINKHQSYYLDLTNQFGNLAQWKLEAIWLLPNVLSTSTCLHALLLTFLRLLCLEMPLKYKQIHIKVKTGEQLYWTIVVF